MAWLSGVTVPDIMNAEFAPWQDAAAVVITHDGLVPGMVSLTVQSASPLALASPPRRG